LEDTVFTGNRPVLRVGNITLLGAGIAVDGRGLFVTCEEHGQRVQLFARDGTFHREVGLYGFEVGKFRFPRGIAVDGKGRVIVVDCANARIQILSWPYYSWMSKNLGGNFCTKCICQCTTPEYMSTERT